MFKVIRNQMNVEQINALYNGGEIYYKQLQFNRNILHTAGEMQVNQPIKIDLSGKYYRLNNMRHEYYAEKVIDYKFTSASSILIV